MKHLKVIIPVLCLLFLASTAFAQATKKNSQMLIVDKIVKKLEININADNVEIKRTKGSRINIETTIKLSAGSVQLLEYLEKSGRYAFDTQTDRSRALMTLIPNNPEKVIVIKGEEVKEEITYTIYVPENILFVKTLDSNEMNALTAAK